MKAKIYPLTNTPSEIEAIASSFCLHIEIICASLAKGTSIIKNIVDSKDIDTTISWCKGIGATIKKSNDKLIIKGVNNIINYQTPLFVCGNTSITAKLMLPLLCTSQQPAGIKANEKIINEIVSYKKILEEFDISFYLENDMVRFEKVMKAKESEIDGDIDIYFAAGLLMALPLLKSQSTLKLRAPIRSEKNYATILKILKHFHIDIKHPATMRYDVVGNQSYKACRIKTDTDKFTLAHHVIISQLLKVDSEPIKVTNYVRGSESEDKLLFDYIKSNVVSFKTIFTKRILRPKEVKVHRMDASIENSLPLLMVLATINKQDSIITKVDFTKERVNKQFEIMQKIFTKLNIDVATYEREVIVSPSKVQIKKQVDCENDPYVAMAISILALLSNVAIVIKNVDCVFDINANFFKDLKCYGAVIEFIHN